MGKESLEKNVLTESFRNLTVEVLSSDNDLVLEFQALTDLCAEINVTLANSVFANHERARLDMKKQAEDTSAKNTNFLTMMMVIRISQMIFQLNKKVISPTMFQLNKKVMMKLTIGKQFTMHPQKG